MFRNARKEKMEKFKNVSTYENPKKKVQQTKCSLGLNAICFIEIFPF
jgi:hypothetical protein